MIDGSASRLLLQWNDHIDGSTSSTTSSPSSCNQPDPSKTRCYIPDNCNSGLCYDAGARRYLGPTQVCDPNCICHCVP